MSKQKNFLDNAAVNARAEHFLVVGVPKEIKPQEGRVGLTPEGAATLTSKSIKVILENNAGIKSGFSDADYIKAGAKIVETAKEVWGQADIIKKVKEPLPEEYAFIKPSHILFTYLHLADNKKLTEFLLESGCLAIAYETILKDGQTPLLAPMSIVAGVLGAYQAAFYSAKSMLKENFESLLDDLNTENFFERPPIDLQNKSAVILGGGIVGENCGMILAKMKAKVYISEINPERGEKLKNKFQQAGLEIEIINPNTKNLIPYLKEADIIVGAVYILGKSAPILIDRDQLATISQDKKKVVVDVAIDQGGNIYGSKATTHQDPTFLDEFGNTRYCVANMPGRVPWVSSGMLEAATLPYLEALALKGINATEYFPELAGGINIINSKLVEPGVAKSLDLPLSPLSY